MTDNPHHVLVHDAHRRSDLELALDQVRAIDAWVQAHSARDDEAVSTLSREDRLDQARRRDVVSRQRQAIEDWTERELRAGGDLQQSVAASRAVIAHRHAWLSAKVTAGLQAGGVTVVAELDNGAEALGVVVAEQPDLLLVGDKLAMVSGLDLCRAVRSWSPRTLVAVQVAEDWQVGPFLDAGAASVFTRRIPPADIAAQLAEALTR